MKKVSLHGANMAYVLIQPVKLNMTQGLSPVMIAQSFN